MTRVPASHSEGIGLESEPEYQLTRGIS